MWNVQRCLFVHPFLFFLRSRQQDKASFYRLMCKRYESVCLVFCFFLVPWRIFLLRTSQSSSLAPSLETSWLKGSPPRWDSHVYFAPIFTLPGARDQAYGILGSFGRRLWPPESLNQNPRDSSELVDPENSSFVFFSFYYFRIQPITS